MKKIIFTRADGGLSVMGPCEGTRLAKSVTFPDGTVMEGPLPADQFLRRWPVAGVSVEWAETENEFYARIIAKDVPKDATNIAVVDDSKIPTDRTFRDAWTISGGAVDHDMDKCREIHKRRLRELRAPKLAALDVEFMRAVEAGDTNKQREIAGRKQALRDVTTDLTIVAAKTPAELKVAVPDALK